MQEQRKREKRGGKKKGRGGKKRKGDALYPPKLPSLYTQPISNWLPSKKSIFTFWWLPLMVATSNHQFLNNPSFPSFTSVPHLVPASLPVPAFLPASVPQLVPCPCISSSISAFLLHPQTLHTNQITFPFKFPPNFPFHFARHKSIYKPPHFDPKSSPHHLLSFPLISTTLYSYPPATNWTSTAVQKLATHYFSFLEFQVAISFFFLLCCYYCYVLLLLLSFLFLSFYLLVTGNHLLCLTYCSTSLRSTIPLL